LRLRMALWPEDDREQHLEQMRRFLAEPERFAQFIVRLEGLEAAGFAEASVRHDHVNGTHTTPVAFLEGLYVAPSCRRRGVACRLVDAVARWAAGRGCTELGSDTDLDNAQSQAVHARLGFTETERVVFFRRALGGADEST